MKKNSTTRPKTCNESKSIRVSTSTKGLIDKKLTSLNKSDEYGKVTYDSLIHFLIKEMTKDQARMLQNSTVTWVMEEKRLKTLWSKKYSKGIQVSEEKWKQMLYLGTLQDFIRDNSRISF